MVEGQGVDAGNGTRINLVDPGQKVMVEDGEMVDRVRCLREDRRRPDRRWRREYGGAWAICMLRCGDNRS